MKNIKDLVWDEPNSLWEKVEAKTLASARDEVLFKVWDQVEGPVYFEIHQQIEVEIINNEILS
jgi:hypothetical protein